MNYKEQLKKIIHKNRGMVFTSELEEQHIPRQYLSMFVAEQKLERVSHGVYISPDVFDDPMHRLQSKNQKTVYSHETAAYLHGFTDRDPFNWTVTVPYGYNASHLRAAGLKVHSIKREWSEIGLTKKKTIHGREVVVTSPERTLCDLFRHRNQSEPGVFVEALKRYVRSEDRHIPLLLRYARQFGIETKLNAYLELIT